MERQEGVILLSLSPFRLLPKFKGQLEAAGQGREVLVSEDPAEIRPFLDRIEIGFGDVPFDLLPRMPALKWIQLWSAGADRLQQFPEVKGLPFLLTTTRGIHGQQIAEHLFAMLLSWNRRLPEAFAARKRREWLFVSDRYLSGCRGKTMLIAGYGAIGEAVARIALAFGMEVIGLRRNPEKGGLEGLRVEDASLLRELLPGADYVVNILPATQDTRHVFSTAEFGLMKKTALYANMGRGSTTDETALIRVLRDKGIAGALLDVTEKEPLPGDSPLWELDNVILTGHYAGGHYNYSRMAMEVALDNLSRYICGHTLKNLVDKQAGY
jgi:phosphoglycerate dehydrogenase-like enzyme